MTEIFAKVLTQNDDSGRHGVLIPDAAYSFFPLLTIRDPNENATEEFDARDARTNQTKRLAWKYYQRYPERRVTRIGTQIDSGHPFRIIVFRRRKNGEYEFEFATTPEAFSNLVAIHLTPRGVEPKPGAFVRYQPGTAFKFDGPLRELLDRFDTFDCQWHPTRREGDVGVGVTLESLFGIKENNDRTADFRGIEIKAKLRSAAGATNLFQQGPVWKEHATAADRIRTIGKRGPDGLWSCHSKVTVTKNNLGLSLVPLEQWERIGLNRFADEIGFWDYSTLETRLTEKHARAVFIKANQRIVRGISFYQYDELVYCERPNITNFVTLTKARDIFMEFLMSERKNGTIRNHGYPWRIRNHSVLSQLFAFQVKLRG